MRNGKRMTMTALVTASLAACFGLVRPGAAPAHAAGPPAAQVKIVDAPDPNQPKGYEPASITVKAGQAVNWTNTGNEGHTVTADDNSFDSGLKQHGEAWSNTFTKPGTYAYHCTPHPWMKGVVKVTGSRG